MPFYVPTTANNLFNKERPGMISLLKIRYRCLAIQSNKSEHWWRPVCISHPAAPHCVCTLTSPPTGLVLQLSDQPSSWKAPLRGTSSLGRPKQPMAEAAPSPSRDPRSSRCTWGLGSCWQGQDTAQQIDVVPVPCPSAPTPPPKGSQIWGYPGVPSWSGARSSFKCFCPLWGFWSPSIKSCNNKPLHVILSLPGKEPKGYWVRATKSKILLAAEGSFHLTA